MAHVQTGGKKSRLTLYIFIGLFLGIGVGVLLNKNYVNYENKELHKIDDKIQANTVLIGDARLQGKEDTGLPAPVIDTNKLVTENTKLAEKKVKLNESRDTKLQYFTALSENIFLRLIKMIVALLVFSTLVVGVARLGDIKAVGRIGGKTLLWFLSASFVSFIARNGTGKPVQTGIDDGFAASGCRNIDGCGESSAFVQGISKSRVPEKSD